MAEGRSTTQVRRAIATEREQLTTAIREFRAELADVRTRRLRVAKGAGAGFVGLVAALKILRRRR